jgi:hypothetical protein
MKKTITLLAIIMVSLVNAQAFKGKGDIKTQVGGLLEHKFEQWAESNKAITTATKGKENPF